MKEPPVSIHYLLHTIQKNKSIQNRFLVCAIVAFDTVMYTYILIGSIIINVACINIYYVRLSIYAYVAGCGTAGMLYGLICCLFAIPCVYTCTFRTKLRSKYGLPDAPAPDWITHCFCEYCALCQEYRELKNRGLDPSIGKPTSS